LPRAAYAEVMRSAFSDEPGARNIARESFAYRGGLGFLISGDMGDGGAAQRRFFLIANPPDDEVVGFVRVAVPEAARAQYSDDVIRTMLASMTFRQTPLEEQLAQLPFRLEDLAGFRVARIMQPGTVLLVDAGPGAQIDLSRQAHVIVTVGQGSAANADERGRAARKLMEGVPLRDIRLQSGEAQRIDNAPGYEIRAQAQTPTNADVSVVQWVRFGTVGYMQIVGVSPRENWDTLFPRFRAVRDGINPR